MLLKVQCHKQDLFCQKALEMNLKVIICVNKIDKPDARLGEVEEEVLDLLLDLGAGDEALDYPIVYCSGQKWHCNF